MKQQVHTLSEKNKLLENDNINLKQSIKMYKENEVLLCKKNKKLQIESTKSKEDLDVTLLSNNSENNISNTNEIEKYIKEIDTLKVKLKNVQKEEKERENLLDDFVLFCMLCLQDIRASYISFKEPPPVISEFSREEREHFLNVILERVKQSRENIINHSGYKYLAPVNIKKTSLAEALHSLESNVDKKNDLSLPIITKKVIRPKKPAPSRKYKRWSRYYK